MKLEREFPSFRGHCRGRGHRLEIILSLIYSVRGFDSRHIEMPMHKFAYRNMLGNGIKKMQNRLENSALNRNEQ